MAMFETLSSLLASKVGAAVAAGALVATAGAAAATLPDQAADEAQQQVENVDPQDVGAPDTESLDAERGPDEDADDTAHRVWDVIQNWEGDRGCDFGQSVADAANDGEAAPDEFPCDQADERRAAAEDRRADAEDRRAEAGDRSEEADDRRAQAEGRAEDGRDNAPSDAGTPSQADTGLGIADDARP